MAVTPCRHRQKQSYPTLEAAEFELRDYKRTAKANKKLINRMQVYRCPDGPHWHLGHNNPPSQRRQGIPR